MICKVINMFDNNKKLPSRNAIQQIIKKYTFQTKTDTFNSFKRSKGSSIFSLRANQTNIINTLKTITKPPKYSSDDQTLSWEHL